MGGAGVFSLLPLLRDPGRELAVKTAPQSRSTETPCPPFRGPCGVGRHCPGHKQPPEGNTGKKILQGWNVVPEGLDFPGPWILLRREGEALGFCSGVSMVAGVSSGHSADRIPPGRRVQGCWRVQGGYWRVQEYRRVQGCRGSGGCRRVQEGAVCGDFPGKHQMNNTAQVPSLTWYHWMKAGPTK